MVPFRLLLAEDYEPFRRLVCSILQQRADFRIVGQASDGLEAVQKAQELQPDLVVLDIGLPSLNGIEAARRIRKLSPKSKILFLSQESSADAVHEALGLGALGYVVKARAGTELLPALDAVLQGNRFVGMGLSGHRFSDLEAPTPDGLSQKKGLSSHMHREGKATHCHEVDFYDDDASFVRGFTFFIQSALKAGNAAVLFASESHRKSIHKRLQSDGVDVAAAIEQGRFISLRVAEVLSKFMVNDEPDPLRFSKVVGDLLADAAKRSKAEPPRVAVCGECAPTLLEQSKADNAIRVEHLCDDIAKTHDVDILCGYVMKSSQCSRESDVYRRICAEHSNVCAK